MLETDQGGAMGSLPLRSASNLRLRTMNYISGAGTVPQRTFQNSTRETGCQMAASHQLTSVNGIKRKPNGRFTVYLRLNGGGTTRLLSDSVSTFEEAVEIRARAITAADRLASAVGICRLPLGWRAQIRWGGQVFHLGTFAHETTAATCRCRFDAWAATKSFHEVREALELHCRGPHTYCHKRLETLGKIDV